RVLIETRGEGGYALAPGSPGACHETGGEYRHLSGPKVSQVQDVSPDEREVLLRCARYFSRVAEEPSRPTFKGQAQSAATGLGDHYDLHGPDWPEIIGGPHGWAHAYQKGPEHRYRRPGKDGRGWSATT